MSKMNVLHVGCLNKTRDKVIEIVIVVEENKLEEYKKLLYEFDCSFNLYEKVEMINNFTELKELLIKKSK